MNIVKSAKQVIVDMKLKTMLKKYLLTVAEDHGEPWRDKQALQKTIEDVFAMDVDLREYALGFLQGQVPAASAIKCEVASISQLLETGEFTPITAALFIQWYRREPKSAAAFLLQRDTIINLPEQAKDNDTETGATDDNSTSDSF